MIHPKVIPNTLADCDADDEGAGGELLPIETGPFRS